jgi:TonB family protein
MYPKEANYKGVAMLMFPPQAGSMGVAMIGQQLIAVGKQDQLKSIADAYAGRKKSVMSKSKMAAELANQWYLSASGKMPSQDAGSFLVTRGLMVKQNQSQLDLLLNVPANAIESFWKLLGPSDSGGVEAPIPFLKPMPPVTEEAKKAKLQGTMKASMLVRKDGTAANITILKPLGHGMEQSAIATITDFWRFLPALNNNRSIEAQTTIDIPFTYQDNRWK